MEEGKQKKKLSWSRDEPRVPGESMRGKIMRFHRESGDWGTEIGRKKKKKRGHGKRGNLPWAREG